MHTSANSTFDDISYSNTIQVRIIRIDPARKRIVLSMRRVESDDGNYPVDDDAYDYDPDELEKELVATVGGGVSAATVATEAAEVPAEIAATDLAEVPAEIVATDDGDVPAETVATDDGEVPAETVEVATTQE